MRPDRDQNIVVNFANILAGMSSQFDLNPSTDYYGGVYDVGGIMHYGSKVGMSRLRCRQNKIDKPITSSLQSAGKEVIRLP
jgi:hypothetical protein